MPQSHYIDHGLKGRGQNDAQGAYCGLNTASEMFLIFYHAGLRH